MIGEFGHFLLICSLFSSFFAICLGQSGIYLKNSVLQQSIKSVPLINLFLIFGSFLSLLLSYVFSDFSLLNVWKNSHQTQPLLYKITGVWGNHEGSLLLWLLLLVLVNYFFSLTKILPSKIYFQALVFQNVILLSFLLFVLLTSNPFTRLWPVPYDGIGLNPILQDPALAFHPPLLYFGYALTSIPFCLVLSCLITSFPSIDFHKRSYNLGIYLKNWIVLSWIFLTLGISLGSWWSYYELGWGGFWAWDPVENASLMPWLANTALLHSSLVNRRTKGLFVWTILLSILSFCLSILGLFLVRSGILVSIHAFSVDPLRGSFILLLLFIYVFSSLFLFWFRAPGLYLHRRIFLFSREGFILLNNLLVLTLLSIIFVGTLYPLFLEFVSGYKISVGSPFFELTFSPFALLLLFLLPLGPLLLWGKSGSVSGLFFHSYPSLLLTLLIILLLFSFGLVVDITVLFFLSFGIWVLCFSFYGIIELIFSQSIFSLSFSSILVLLRRSSSFVCHFGFGVLAIGVISSSMLSREVTSIMSVGDELNFSSVNFKLKSFSVSRPKNYVEHLSKFVISSKDFTDVIDVSSSKRYYDRPSVSTSEVGISGTPLGSNYYISFHGSLEGDRHSYTFSYHPLVNWIWYGSIMMVIGCGLSLIFRFRKE